MRALDKQRAAIANIKIVLTTLAKQSQSGAPLFTDQSNFRKIRCHRRDGFVFSNQ